MEIDRTVGFADWPQTEVVGPADQHPIEPFHHCPRILPDFVAPGLVADSSTDTLYPILGWYRAQIDSTPPHRVAASERLSRPAEFHHRPLAEPSVKLSPHSAPIKQTRQSFRSANVQRDPRIPSQAVEGTDSLGFCGA